MPITARDRRKMTSLYTFCAKMAIFDKNLGTFATVTSRDRRKMTSLYTFCAQMAIFDKN